MTSTLAPDAHPHAQLRKWVALIAIMLAVVVIATPLPIHFYL